MTATLESKFLRNQSSTQVDTGQGQMALQFDLPQGFYVWVTNVSEDGLPVEGDRSSMRLFDSAGCLVEKHVDIWHVEDRDPERWDGLS